MRLLVHQLFAPLHNFAPLLLHPLQDLLQHPERIKWYESKFCADDMPDWNMGR